MDSTVPWNTAEYSAEVSQVDLILDHGLSVLVFFLADFGRTQREYIVSCCTVLAIWVWEKNYVGNAGCEP